MTYKDFIPKKTKSVFEKLANAEFIKKYTLVGGTALSLQIEHRLSEDLDFIFDGIQLDTNLIKKNINKLFNKYRIIRIINKSQIDFVIDDVKVTFFTSDAVNINFQVIKHSFNYKNINIANIDCISVLKFSAIAQRNTMRDYYDLYYIAKYKSNLSSMIAKTKSLLPHLSPITYSESLVYIEDIDENNLSNHLKPKENITKEKIANYFIKELKKIINN